MQPLRFDSRHSVFTVAALITFGVPGALRTQGPAPAPIASVPAAMSRFYGGDPAGAARILESVTKSEPQNVSAWRLLGLCYRTSGDLDRARSA
jgi:Tfp pilus assembly protein PilF